MKQKLLVLFIFEALCVTVINTQPVYSHPHNASTTKLRYKASIEDSAAKHTLYALDTPPFSRHFLTKRQTSDLTADEQYCHIQLLDILCSSGYYQPEADAFLACGAGDVVHFHANLCAQNAMGQYCQTVNYKLTNVDPDLNYVDRKCSAALSSGSCPSNCRAQLQLLKDKLGCCPFEYLEHSYSNRLVFDHRLWNLCYVSLSIPPCRSPHISQANQRTCTEEEVIRTYIPELCQPGGVGQNFVSKILDNERCSQVYADFNSSALWLVRYCTQNAQGEYCGLLDEFGPLSSTVCNINTRCRSSNSRVCNQTCMDTIMEAKRSLGCCVNHYNNSAVEPEFIYVSSYEAAVSYDLWNSCGVEQPGTCESTLSLTPSGSQNHVQSGITIWIIAALMVFIQR